MRAALVAVAVAGPGERVIRATVSNRPRWCRQNYRDRPVVLSAGPALAAGAMVSAVSVGAPGALIAGAAAAALGLYDDLYGDSHARGLRGHLAALRQGRLTTGMVKLLGLGAAGLVAAVAHARDDPARTSAASIATDAALVAGTANLVNLFDLRPGRALKAVTVASGLLARRPGAAGAVAIATAAAAAVTLPADLGERAMIGDCGANAAGAMIGWSAAAGLPRRGRAAVLALVVGLTLASERVSFSEVIQANPTLRAIDGWGRP